MATTVRDTAHKKKTKKGVLLTPTSKTSPARTEDPKPDLNAPSEFYVKFAFNDTMDLNAEAQSS
jgi:hypothetical protein